MKRKFFIIFISCMFLVSCIEAEQIEKIGIINARGTDVLEDGLLDMTVVIFQFSSESSPIARVRSGKAYTLKGAIEDAEHQSSFRLTPGKIKIEMYGKETAKQGILPYLDTISRDARMSDMMYLTLSDTTAKEILSVDESTLSTDVGQYLYDLIDSSGVGHNIPRKTLQDFLRIYYDIGQDNVLPIFGIRNGVPKQKAIAILQGDRYIGEITNEQSTLINLVVRTVKRQLFELSLPIDAFKGYLENREQRPEDEKLRSTFRIEQGKSETKVINEDNLHFQTDVSLQMRLLEQSAGIIIKNKHVIELLEEEVEKKVKKQFQELLTELQELNADPFGYGRYYRLKQKDGKITDEEWREKFPQIKVDFNVDTKIFRHGITE